MESISEEKRIYQFFLGGVLLKGVISLAEIVAGILFFFVTPQEVINFILSVSAMVLPKMLQGLTESILNAVGHELMIVSAAIIGLYLLTRGLIKFFLIWAMLKNILWAYPWSLVVLGLFVFSQLYQIAMTQSLLIVGVTLFDLVVMYFIWREYRIVEAHQKHQHKAHSS